MAKKKPIEPKQVAKPKAPVDEEQERLKEMAKHATITDERIDRIVRPTKLQPADYARAKLRRPDAPIEMIQ